MIVSQIINRTDCYNLVVAKHPTVKKIAKETMGWTATMLRTS